jgi:carboxylate-amine ligase
VFPAAADGGVWSGRRSIGGATDAITFGVEEEFLVVDRRSRALAPRSPLVMDAAHPVMGDTVSPELNRCQIEVASSVCTTVD